MAIMHRIHDILYFDLELENIKRIRPTDDDRWSIDTTAGDILIKKYPMELIGIMARVIKDLQEGKV